MEHLENLRTIAEVATTFAGFTGVVIVLGHRSAGTWSDAERSTIKILLESAIGVVFLALLPAVLVLDLSPATAWRVSAGLLTVYHLAVLIRADVLEQRQAGQLIGRRLDWGLSIIGVVCILATAAVAFGFLPSAAALIYTLSLLQMLLVATVAFVALLFSGWRPTA